VAKPLWDWQVFQPLAASYAGSIVRLSGESLALFLSTEELTEFVHWRYGDAIPDQSQQDDIEALVAQAYEELMINPLIGTLFPLITDVIPDGALECDGATYNRVDYPNLYAALASPYIVDADTFTVPDLRGRTIIGAGAGAGLSTYASGDTGGEESHVLTTAELAAHSHGVTDPSHTHVEGIAAPNVTTVGPGAPQPTAIPAVGATGAAFTGISIQNTGSDSAHENRQPYFALRIAVWAM